MAIVSVEKVIKVAMVTVWMLTQPPAESACLEYIKNYHLHMGSYNVDHKTPRYDKRKCSITCRHQRLWFDPNLSRSTLNFINKLVLLEPLSKYAFQQYKFYMICNNIVNMAPSVSFNDKCWQCWEVKHQILIDNFFADLWHA